MDILSSLGTKRYVVIFFSAVAVVCPGFLIMFQFKPKLFEELNAVLVFIFSISISTPIFILFLIFFRSLIQKMEEVTDSEYQVGTILTLSGLLTIVGSYTSLLIAYFLALNFIWFLLTLFTVLVIIMTGVYFQNKKRLKLE